MNILSSTISRIARLRYWKIESWKEQPYDAQQDVFEDLMTHVQYTEIGNKYQLDETTTQAEFREKMPLQEYEDLKPDVDKILAGQENVLWNTPINWFAKSSGTSNDKSKFIPVTEESLEKCHYQGSKDVLSMYYAHNPESELLTGKGLVVGGSHQVSQFNDKIYYGDLSAILMQNTPFWGEWLRTPELSIALMDEWETKIEAMAQATAKENVTSIAGVPTWTIVLIKRILEITGKETLQEVWPNLELYMHGGVSFLPYKEQMNKLIGKSINYRDMYNASEGFFAAQEFDEDEGMLLLLNHGIYYEFLPINEYGKAKPQTCTLSEVELETNYALVISTNGGLWRYILGDTIKFTSIQPFKIKVSGRLKSYINAFGEELIVDNTDKAITAACQATSATVNEYTAAPIYFSENANGAHEWIIEFSKAPADLNHFTEVLDQNLQKLNSDYEAKRHKDIALRQPIVHSVPLGTFTAWMKEKGKLGGQHKVPRLSNNRQYVDQIIAMPQCQLKDNL